MPKKCIYKEKKFWFGFEDCLLQNCHIITFHSTCWKEPDAGMHPTAQIKHFSTASRPLAYYEQLSNRKLLHETLEIKQFLLILICCP